MSDRCLGTETVVLSAGQPACVLRPGLTGAAASVEQAVLQVVGVDRLARISLRVVAACGTRVDRPEAHIAEPPDLDAAFNTVHEES